jgi:predicted dehydrogenase
VGLGKMGLMHASIMAMLDDVKLVAVCEKSGFIRRFGKKVIPNIDMVASLEDLHDKKLDAICVTTPPSSHFTIIKTAYEKGIAKHVFTEKPLAINYSQAEELCSLAEKYGGVNMVGYQRRFSVTFRKARQILEAGDIGKPSFFKGYAYSADFLGARTSSQTKARGGVIEDSGCHVIDITLWLLGEMKVLNAEVKSLIGDGSEDEAFIEVGAPDGLKGEFRASWCKEGYRLPDIALCVTGSKGNLTVSEDKVELDLNNDKSSVWYKHDLDDNVPFFIGGTEYQRQDDLFIKAIRDGIKAEPSFRTASRVHDLIDQTNRISKMT